MPRDRQDNDNDLVLIGGLMAFLLYCRVVHGRQGCDGERASAEVRSKSELGGAAVPDHAGADDGGHRPDV